MKSLSCFIILITTALALVGCADPVDRGKLYRAQEVATSFENGEILPDHTYYYAGAEAQPDAIIAIDNSYSFERGYWQEVTVTKEKIETWNRIIANEYRSRSKYNGFRIMTPDGAPVGIWYGRYSFTVIKFPEPKKVVIYTPDPTPSEVNIRGGGFGGFRD